MQIESVPITTLKPSPYNPRTISKHDYAALKRSLQEFGPVDPLIVNRHPGREHIVIGGHQRLRAMKDLGLTEAPVVYVDVDEAKERALNLALNRIRGQFDPDPTAELLRALERDGMAELSGFTSKELDHALHTAGFGEQHAEDPFRIEQALGEGPTQTQLGDIVELGPHRLACGDARDPALMTRLMAGGAADMLFSDPPYNVDYQGGRLGGILNDAQAPEAFQLLITDAFRTAFSALSPGGAFYICMGWSGYPGLMRALAPLKVHLANVIIWVKDNAPLGWHDYRYSHELLVKGKAESDKGNALAYGWKDGTHYFAPIRDEADLWYIRRRNARDYLHPTQKPVGLITRAITNSTKPGAIILDPFGGSGSTLIAAASTKRVARLIELDPKFCDVIRRRWDAYTAKANGHAHAAA